MSAADPRPSLCDWLVQHHGGLLREAVRLTDDHNVEHGFVVIGWPDDMDTTRIISGSERTIDVATHVTTAYRPVRVGVHTHPSGALVPSENDWRGFLTRHGQYAPGADFPDGWRRGMVIAGRRLGESDQFGIRALEVTTAGANLSVADQREWVERAFDVLDDPSVGALGTAEDKAEAIGPQVRTCIRTVDE